MKMTRTEAREKIMVILYQIDFYMREKMEFDINDVIKENIDIDNKYVNDIVNGVVLNLSSLDEIISKYLDGWDLNRLGQTDKAILRLGAYEILHYDTPKIVAINEAVELSKKYSDDKVVKLINAVLDKIRDNEGLDE